MTSRQTTDHQLKPPFSTACLSRDPHRKRKSFQSRLKIKFLQGCMKLPPHCAIILWLSSALSLICKPPQILWSCGLTLTGVGSHSIVSIADDDEDDRRPLPLVIVLATGDCDVAVAARRPQWGKFFLFNSSRSGHPSFLRRLRVSDRSQVKILPRIQQPANRSGGPSASWPDDKFEVEHVHKM